MSFTLSHPGGLRIHAGMSESEARTASPYLPRDMKTGYVWYYLGEATIEGDPISISLCFFRGKLCSISLSVRDPRFGSNWSDWSPDKERERAAATSAWLARIGFPVGRYPWGEVWAGLDERGGGGSGSIRFS